MNEQDKESQTDEDRRKELLKRWSRERERPLTRIDYFTGIVMMQLLKDPKSSIKYTWEKLARVAHDAAISMSDEIDEKETYG